jgi:hypothetical protein
LPLAPVDEESNGGGNLLPHDLGPALLKILGPQAVSELRWALVPCVALLARGAVPEAALAAAALAGVPVSPSLAGPHSEEAPTVVDVFLKAQAGGGSGGQQQQQQQRQQQRRYPETRLLILRDGGVLALGADIDEAAAAFARAARAGLLGDGAYAAVSEACGLGSSNNGPAAAAASSSATLDAFEGLGSGALLLPGGGGGGNGIQHVGSHPLQTLGSGSLPGGPGDTAGAVPLLSLGGAAAALRRLGHSLLGGRPSLGGRVSDGAAAAGADIISLGDTAGGAEMPGGGGGAGVARAGALRPSLPGVRGLFHGVGGMRPTPFAAMPAAGPPSSAGLPPPARGWSGLGGASNGGRKVSLGQMISGRVSGSGALPPVSRKGSEAGPPAAALRSGLPSFTSGLRPW